MMLKNFRNFKRIFFKTKIISPFFYYSNLKIEQQKLKQVSSISNLTPQQQSQVQVPFELDEFLKVKSLLAGKDIESQDNEDKPFFHSEQQTLSFQLIKIDTLVQLYSLAQSKTYIQCNNPNLLYLIFYRYLHLKRAQIQEQKMKEIKQKTKIIQRSIISQRIKPILNKLLINMNNMEEKLLDSFLQEIVTHRIYLFIKIPSSIPLINNCSHTSSTLLLNLLTLYPSSHSQIIKYYNLQSQVIIPNTILVMDMSFQVLVQILKYLPNEQSILKIIQHKLNIIIKQDEQLTSSYQDLAKATIISIHTQQLHWFAHYSFKQLQIIEHINHQMLIQLLYNCLTTNFNSYYQSIICQIEQSIDNLGESIVDQQSLQESIKQSLGTYHLLWNSLIIILREHKNIKINKITMYLLSESLTISLQRLRVQDFFEIFVNFATIISNKQVQLDQQLVKRVLIRFLGYSSEQLSNDELAIVVIVSFKLKQLDFILKNQRVLQFLQNYNGKYSKIIKDILLKYKQKH